MNRLVSFAIVVSTLVLLMWDASVREVLCRTVCIQTGFGKLCPLEGEGTPRRPPRPPESAMLANALAYRQ
jgi:hypothetical protein